MWRPSQRIKWNADPGDWPSREVAAASALFSPLDAGRLHLNQRTWVPAMVPWRATGDGFVTADVLAWYERFAQGRPGAIVVEATGIRDIPSGPLLRIGDDRFIPGLTELVETVKRASDGETKLFIQLIDFDHGTSSQLNSRHRMTAIEVIAIGTINRTDFGIERKILTTGKLSIKFQCLIAIAATHYWDK